MPTSVVILAWAAGIAAVGLAALIDVLGRARRLHRQRALGDLAALSWQQFEEVIADAFRRHGYRVRETGGRGTADGGVDLVLTRDGETTVVQAKHWRSQRVSVQPVRELYGVQRAMHAERSMFVSTARYTADAARFAAQVGMTLVDGEELLRIIGAGLAGGALQLPVPEAAPAPTCPACGDEMALRTARRGALAGREFGAASATRRAATPSMSRTRPRLAERMGGVRRHWSLSPRQGRTRVSALGGPWPRGRPAAPAERLWYERPLPCPRTTRRRSWPCSIASTVR